MQSLTIRTKRYELIAILFLCSLWLVICTHRMKKNSDKTIRRYSTTNGEPIAVDDLIQNWEHEHRKFSQQETKTYLRWEALNKNNVNEYCRKYLQKCVPGRTTIDAIGFKYTVTLHYGVESIKNGVTVELLTCKTQNNRLIFHITRAPEPNCVYAARRKRVGPVRRFNNFMIINKHCDFEESGSVRVENRKNLELKEVYHYHEFTGQPIATDEILRQHELDHQKLHQMGNAINYWPREVTHNIDEYCSNYLQKCIPFRNHKDVVGRLDNGMIKYHKENLGDLCPAVILRCYSIHTPNRAYYLARAFDPNCIYALLRSEGRYKKFPFQIIYKHCGFIHYPVKLETVGDSGTLDQTIQNGTRVMLKDSTVTETLEFFPQN